MKPNLDDTYLVIPTAGRTKYLDQIFSSSGIDSTKAILVWTKKIENDFPNCVNLQYEGDFNISKWWNFGIEYAASKGAKYVAVLNDDTWIQDGLIADMRHQLSQSGSALAISSSQKSDSSSSGGGWGHCWMLNLQFNILPDNRFIWWFGDYDLMLRAERIGISVSTLLSKNLEADANTENIPELKAIVKSDYKRYLKKHKKLYLQHLKQRFSPKEIRRQISKLSKVPSV